MTLCRTFIALALVVGMAVPGYAQNTPAPVQVPSPPAPAPSGKALVYSGAAVFAGGLATALYGFIRVGNGQFSTFGEATSRNKPLGAAGLAAAFAGGTMMFLGSRARRYAPSAVSLDRRGVAVEKTLTW